MQCGAVAINSVRFQALRLLSASACLDRLLFARLDVNSCLRAKGEMGEIGPSGFVAMEGVNSPSEMIIKLTEIEIWIIEHTGQSTSATAC